MADNSQRTPGTGEAIAADEVTDGTLGSCKVQFVKLMDGTLDGTTKAAIGANGLAVNEANSSAIKTAVELIDDAVYVDDADWTNDTSKHVLVGGLYQSTPQTITDGDVGPLEVDANGKLLIGNPSIAGTAGSANAGVLSVQGIASMTPVQVTVNSITAGDTNIGNVDVVSLPASTNTLEVVGDVAHDAAVGGNPVLIGAKAISAFPAEVSTGDAAYNLADMMGRQLVTHIPNTEQKSKAYNDTSSRAAGAAVAALTGTSGKKLAITGFTISAYGTTAGRIFLYLALASDTTYTAGTDKPVFVGSFAPSATSYPGVVVMLPVPIFAETDTHVVMYQNSAAISIDMVFHYYEVE